MQLRSKRPHAGVLVGKRKARLALVGCDQVEALEIEDVAPPACNLAVGDPEGAGRQGADQLGDRAAVEDAVAKIAEHYCVAPSALDLFGHRSQDRIGNRPIIERIHLQQAVIAADKGVLLRRRPGTIDNRLRADAGLLEAVDDEIAHRIVAEHRRKSDLGPRRCEMSRYDSGAADKILAPIEPHARCRRLGHAADHRRMGEAVDDRIADDMHCDAAELAQELMQLLESDPLGLHQHQQFVDRDVGRPRFDQRRGGVDDVAGSKQHLAAVALDDRDLLLGLRMQPAILIFITFGEEIGLDARQIPQWRRILVDNDVVDHFERGEIEGAQLLRHKRPVMRLVDMDVRGQAGDQEIGFALGIEQMPEMAWMHQVENAVALYHHLALRLQARDDLRQCAYRKYLAVALGFRSGRHAGYLDTRLRRADDD